MHRKALPVLLLCLLASACSVKMAYNNADRFIRWGVSDYVDLNREQKRLLKKELEVVHLWHRRNHLPLYADFAADFARVSSDGVSAAKMADVFNQMEFWAEEVEEKLNPLVIEIMVSLTDEQVAELPEKLRENNAELAEPEQDATLEEAQEEWASEFAEALKTFIGKVDDEQKAYLARRSLEYQPERVLWAEYRSRWQADLLALLAERKADDFAQRYARLVEARKSYYGEALTEVDASNRRLNQDTAAYILSNMNPRQSEKFNETLLGLAKDFRELSNQS